MRTTAISFLALSTAAALAAMGASAAAAPDDPVPPGAGMETPAEVVAALTDVAPFAVQESETVFGGAEPVSPSLLTQDGTAHSAGTPSTSTISLAPADGFVVDGLAVRLLGVATDAPVGATINDTAVVQPGTAADTSTIVRPTSVGVETFTVIGSEAAPEATTWSVDLPESVELRPTEHGAIALVDTEVAQGNDAASAATDAPPALEVDDVEEVVLDPVASSEMVGDGLDQARQELEVPGERGAVVGLVSAPIAWDANGAEVPASLGIDGDHVVLHVEHHASGVAYPVVADPVWWAGATEYTGFGATYPLDKVKNDIDTMKSNGIDYVVLSPQLLQTQEDDTYWYLPDIYKSSTIRFPNRGKGCTVENDSTFDNTYVERLVAAGKYAKSRGLAVVVKPLLNPAEWHWEGDSHYYEMEDATASRTKITGSADADAWWDTYICKMVTYSHIAAQIHAYDAPSHPNLPDVKYVVGTELTALTDQNYDSDRMRELMRKVRAAHPNLDLGYAANYDAVVPAQAALDGYFYEALDFIGVDAYYEAPLQATKNGQTVAVIKSRWGTTLPAGSAYTCESGSNRDVNVDRPGIAIQCLRDRYGKPVVLSELGYVRNASRGFAAAYSFWADWVDARPGRCTWFKGIWLWAENTGPDDFDLTAADFDQAQAKARGQLTAC